MGSEDVCTSSLPVVETGCKHESTGMYVTEGAGVLSVNDIGRQAIISVSLVPNYLFQVFRYPASESR